MGEIMYRKIEIRTCLKNSYSALFGLCLLSTPLLAEPAAAASEGIGSNAISQVLMLGAFAFIFYFLILRPQSKRAKQQRELITNLQKGDEVVTAGGILGKIHRVADNFLVLMIAEGVEIVVQKQAIAGSLPKGTIKNI